MAIIKAEIDTKKKTLVVTQNDKKVGDVKEVIFTNYDNPHVEIYISTTNEDDSYTSTRIYANKDGDMKRASGEQISVTPELQRSLSKALLPKNSV